jgi:copper(I)-binding protein
MTLQNAGARELAVVSVQSPAARSVEIHQTREEAGIMRMRRVERLAIPSRGSVVLEPGGLHLMLIDLVTPLVAGATVRFTLTLDDGSRVDVAARVRPLS